MSLFPCCLIMFPWGLWILDFWIFHVRIYCFGCSVSLRLLVISFKWNQVDVWYFLCYCVFCLGLSLAVEEFGKYLKGALNEYESVLITRVITLSQGNHCESYYEDVYIKMYVIYIDNRKFNIFKCSYFEWNIGYSHF